MGHVKICNFIVVELTLDELSRDMFVKFGVSEFGADSEQFVFLGGLLLLGRINSYFLVGVVEGFEVAEIPVPAAADLFQQEGRTVLEGLGVVLHLIEQVLLLQRQKQLLGRQFLEGSGVHMRQLQLVLLILPLQTALSRLLHRRSLHNGRQLLRLPLAVPLLVAVQIIPQLPVDVALLAVLPRLPPRHLLQRRPAVPPHVGHLNNIQRQNQPLCRQLSSLREGCGEGGKEGLDAGGREGVYVIMVGILVIIKNIDKRMEKLVRYRKAFYEKENNLQNGNKRRELLPALAEKSLSTDKLYQSLSHTLPAKLPKKDKPRSNTALFCLHYAQPLLAADHSAHSPPFLRHHQIDALLRARMLDWMVEVTSSYKFGPKTYFDGVSLMDRYFEAERESIGPAKLHIIGVQCMLIASKMEEVFPLKMKTVFEKIGHKKLPMQELVEMEQRIIQSLDYQLNSWTFFDLAMLKIADFATHDQDSRQALGELFLPPDAPQEDRLKAMQDLCSYICKFALYDYDFICDNSAQLLAESAIKATFEIQGVTTPPSFYCCSPILIELTKQKMLKAVQEHKVKFQGLGNINKFAPKEVVQQVEQHQ